jgi:phage-related protein
MPRTDVIFFRDLDGTVPCKQWLGRLYRSERKGAGKVVARMLLLAEGGYELRRPAADLLRDGIYELRARQGTVQYRLLYFFDSEKANVAILVHGFIKQGARVPQADIELAVKRKLAYESNKDKHIFREGDDSNEESS